ncbi:nucleoside phosphorylase domain-containing protein [Aspergillus varians]
MDNRKKQQRYDSIEIGWICIVQCELNAATALLDEQYDDVHPGEGETYILGRMGRHNVVIAYAPAGCYGIATIVRVASKIQQEFQNMRFCLLVGVAGGCPDPKTHERDIRLGDVVVSEPRGNRGGVVQIDMGKRTDEGFKIYSHLNKPHPELLDAIPRLRLDHYNRLAHRKRREMDGYIDAILRMSAEQLDQGYFAFPGLGCDRLFESDYPHPQTQADCADCEEKHVRRRDPPKLRSRVFYGTIGSANNVLRSASERDQLQRDQDILCVEMESAGMMDTLSCLVIRGICDYADSHKNKVWQPYAALAAAAYAKELLTYIAKAPRRRVHGDHCFLGTVPVDDMDRALAENPTSLRQDLGELVNTMSDTTRDFFVQRLPHFHEFLVKYKLSHTSHWVGANGKHEFDGFTDNKAKALLKDPYKKPHERLRAARAHAFMFSNDKGQGLATVYLIHDTVLRMWKYVEY